MDTLRTLRREQLACGAKLVSGHLLYGRKAQLYTFIILGDVVCSVDDLIVVDHPTGIRLAKVTTVVPDEDLSDIDLADTRLVIQRVATEQLETIKKNEQIAEDALLRQQAKKANKAVTTKLGQPALDGINKRLTTHQRNIQ